MHFLDAGLDRQASTLLRIVAVALRVAEIEEEEPWLEWSNTSLSSLTTPHHFNTSSGLGEEAGELYQAIIQGVLVCLFTTVGGVMLVVFCLILVQECKLLYIWAIRRHNEEVAPPSSSFTHDKSGLPFPSVSFLIVTKRRMRKRRMRKEQSDVELVKTT